MGWSLSIPPSADQLTEVARVWNRYLAKDDEKQLTATVAFLFQCISGRPAPVQHPGSSSAPDYLAFTNAYNAFCANQGFDPMVGFDESQDNFFRHFSVSFHNSPPPPLGPSKSVHFVPNPPIATLNDSTLAAFPKLGTASSPVTFATVTRGKGKNKPKPPPSTPSTPQPPSSSPSVQSIAAPAPAHPMSLCCRQPRPLPDALRCTDYTIILNHAATEPSLLHMMHPSKFVCDTCDKLDSVRSPLKLLSGQWSSPNSFWKNFIYTFVGSPSPKDISVFNSILCSPFGPSARGVPIAGF